MLKHSLRRSVEIDRYSTGRPLLYLCYTLKPWLFWVASFLAIACIAFVCLLRFPGVFNLMFEMKSWSLLKPSSSQDEIWTLRMDTTYIYVKSIKLINFS